MNRRMFLRTAGGAAVTIPFLGSIAPARAGQRAPVRFVAMATQHGGLWGEHMWPSDALLTDTSDVGHTIRRGELVASSDGADVSLSQVLTARADRLRPAVLAELNLLRGLDIPFYISHHTGGYLGNFGRHDGEFDGVDALPYVPTIDQVMAWSDGFMGTMAGVTQRSVHIGRAMSWGWSNPVAQRGSVDPLPTTWSSRQLFEDLFGTGTQEGPERRLVVDQVRESWRRLRDGAFGPGRRLSAGDRDRLDAHIERLFEVERRLTASGSCDDVTAPTVEADHHPGAAWESPDPAAAEAYHQIWNDVLAMGLICGSTRIATYNCLHTFEPWFGDWHQDVAHQAWVDLDAEQRMVRGNQRFFDDVFIDLASRLDVPDSDGNTVLHNTLMMWAQESGPATHDAISLPVITAGSAGGALTTGQYLDYRHRESRALGQGETNAILLAQRPGLLYGQFLGTCLRAVGVSDKEWVQASNPGYGIHNNSLPSAWPSYIEQIGSDTLPFLG